MTKKEIFLDILNIMKEDSATKKDLTGAQPEPYLEKIFEDMSQEEFYVLVRTYLASFGIPSHVSIFQNNQKKPEVSLRRYENQLYVVDAAAASGLKKGDQIIKIDGLSISDYAIAHKDFFVSQIAERQSSDWIYLVSHANALEIASADQRRTLRIADSEARIDRPKFQGQYLNDHVYYMKMENFSDEEAIAKLYQESQEALKSVKNLIIDVRVNHGGTDSLYFPLFQYTLPRGKGFEDIDFGDDFGMELLYTKNNTQRRISEFEKALADPHVSEETKTMIKEFTDELIANEDKGYVVYESDMESFLPGLTGLETAPEKIYVLSDVTCGSSGDNFVEMMKLMPKVTVVGRPTLGILDYSNCCFVRYDDFTFVYPTSRSLAIDQGKGMTNIGVLPDIEIPWTPEHLEKDVELDFVLGLIEEKR